MPVMSVDEEKRRDSKREDAHFGQQSSSCSLHISIRLMCMRIDDMTAISPDLEQELRKLEHMFAVDAAKLKEISLQFEHELRQGLSRVSRCLLPSNVSLFPPNIMLYCYCIWLNWSRSCDSPLTNV